MGGPDLFAGVLNADLGGILRGVLKVVKGFVSGAQGGAEVDLLLMRGVNGFPLFSSESVCFSPG